MGDGAVLAVGSLSGEYGNGRWLEEERLLRFLASQDFHGGEDVTVTLDLGKSRSAGGQRRMAGDDDRSGADGQDPRRPSRAPGVFVIGSWLHDG